MTRGSSPIFRLALAAYAKLIRSIVWIENTYRGLIIHDLLLPCLSLKLGLVLCLECFIAFVARFLCIGDSACHLRSSLILDFCKLFGVTLSIGVVCKELTAKCADLDNEARESASSADGLVFAI
jgi:hypothetical protein